MYLQLSPSPKYVTIALSDIPPEQYVLIHGPDPNAIIRAFEKSQPIEFTIPGSNNRDGKMSLIILKLSRDDEQSSHWTIGGKQFKGMYNTETRGGLIERIV